MIDLDELEKLCKYEINRGTVNPYTVNENPIHAMQELITRLRQAEKDAARYRWLRDLTDGSAHEEIGNYPGDMWDAAIDEAMQCK